MFRHLLLIWLTQRQPLNLKRLLACRIYYLTGLEQKQPLVGQEEMTGVPNLFSQELILL